MICFYFIRNRFYSK